MQAKSKTHRIKVLAALTLAASLMLLSSCQPKPSPRPVGYFRLNLPQEHTYQLYSPDTCPFQFEMPTYGKIKPFNDPKVEYHPCWFTIVFPQMKAEITITYYPVDTNLSSLLDDSYTLAYKHSIRADDIEEREFYNPKANVYATAFLIYGNAASPIQFHITDSTKHFFRGSLYFRVHPNSDSLKPAVKFLTQDVIHLIETFRWK